MYFNHTSPPLILHYLFVHPTLCSFSPPSRGKVTKPKPKIQINWKKIRQKNQEQNKKHITKPWSPLCAGHLLLGRELYLGEWLLCSLKSYFHFPSRYQMQMASGLEAGLWAQFPFPAHGFCLVRTCAGLRRCRSLCEFVCANSLLCLEKLFQCGHPPPLALVSSLPPLSNRYHCISRGRI